MYEKIERIFFILSQKQSAKCQKLTSHYLLITKFANYEIF